MDLASRTFWSLCRTLVRQEIDFGDVINPCKKSNTVLDALLGKTEKDAPEEAIVEFMTIAGGYICQNVQYCTEM